MNERKRIAVLFGGRSGEHEVSLASARSILAAIDPQKYETISIGITHDGKWLGGEHVLEAFEQGDTHQLMQVAVLPESGGNRLYVLEEQASGLLMRPIASIDLFFPVLHGTFGEDGCPQGVFEMAATAYAGAGVLASAAGMDKALFKDVMRARSLPVLNSILLTRDDILSHLDAAIQAAEAVSAYPLFTKPANLGSSVGISKCRNRAELEAGLRLACRYDRRIMVEKGLNRPREIEVSVLGNQYPQVSLPGEVIPSDDFYTYEAKYIDGKSELFIPAPLEAGQIARLQTLAREVFLAIDCAGMARVDFLMDRDSQEIYISEINTIPGFTQFSMYPKLWEASGITYSALVDQLIDLALARFHENQQTERLFRSKT